MHYIYLGTLHTIYVGTLRTSTCGAFFGLATSLTSRPGLPRCGVTVCVPPPFGGIGVFAVTVPPRLEHETGFRRVFGFDAAHNFVSRKIQTSEVGVCIIGPDTC